MAKGKNDFGQRIAEWMHGRNGADELSIAVMVLASVLLVVNMFVNTFILSSVALLLAGYVFWRVSSRDVEAREVENHVFLDFVGPVASRLRNPAASAKEMREYKHLKCPECGQRVRVPRGKGKLRITCPTCGEKFEAKS